MSERPKIFGLDLLRSMAIMCVLHAHSAAYILTVRPNDVALHYFGFVGVELFFVLSGFLIGTILLQLFQTSTENRLRQVGYFWVRRWLRTLPSYYVAFIVVAIAVWFINGHNILNFPDYKRLWWFGENLTTKPPALFTIAWSLAVEEWFYLLFPLIALPGVLIFKGQGARIVFATALFMTLVPLLVRIWAYGQGEHGWPEYYRKLVPTRLDGIAIGVLFACCKYFWEDLWHRWRTVWMALGIGILYACTSYFFAHNFFRGEAAGVFGCTWFFTIWSLGLGLLLPVFDGIKTLRWRWLQRGVGHVAAISYSLYLYHTTINMVINAVNIKGWAAWWLSWIVGFVLASLLYWAFERPILRLRDRYFKERIAAAPQSIN